MMSEKLDLLIIYRDGEEKIIENVDDYGIIESGNCFYYISYKHKIFIPIENVKFFGYEKAYNKDFI